MRIVTDSTNPNAAALRAWSVLMHVLFSLLEMFPVFLKLSAVQGPLDAAVDSLNNQDLERIKLEEEVATVIVRELSEARKTLELDAIAHWKWAHQDRKQTLDALAWQQLIRREYRSFIMSS